MAGPNTSTSVMQRRSPQLDGLDDFPTPPWATRAFLAELDDPIEPGCRVWEPAANRGLMADVLRETGAEVFASDVHDYGRGYPIGSFVGQGADVITTPKAMRPGDWLVTNPPFALAEQFVQRALRERFTTALLLRTAFLEGVGRYEVIFARTPPAMIFVHVDRVPMVQGRWDPAASTATAYCWFVWLPCGDAVGTQVHWIRPGARARFGRPEDALRPGVCHQVEIDWHADVPDEEASEVYSFEIERAVRAFRRATDWKGLVRAEFGDFVSMKKRKLLVLANA